MTLWQTIKRYFVAPKPVELAQQQLLDARIARLEAEKTAEDWKAQVDVLRQREERLQAYVNGAAA